MNLKPATAVVTSINRPDPKILAYNQIFNSDVIWVGDTKTPNLNNVHGLTFLSLDKQLNDHPPLSTLASLLPKKHYSRKNLGYIHAINNHAEFILDTDDDNFPVQDYFKFPPFTGKFISKSGNGRLNIYRHFTSDHVWPRGLGYQFKEALVSEEFTHCSVAAWQGLADLDPDVDAVFRLCYSDQIHFDRRPPVVLNQGLYCPFNSQNTFWDTRFITYAYLPSTVTFRFTDILRGYIAQRCFWEHGMRLGFSSANVYQERNNHDLLQDLESELVMYKCVDKLIDILDNCTLTENQPDNLFIIYESLVSHGIAMPLELNILQSWVDCVTRQKLH